jgi:hypothetical protein
MLNLVYTHGIDFESQPDHPLTMGTKKYFKFMFDRNGEVTFSNFTYFSAVVPYHSLPETRALEVLFTVSKFRIGKFLTNIWTEAMCDF